MDSEIQKRIEKTGLVISRIPKWTKDLFIARSKEEFCDDYGMCLASMVKESEEYNRLKEMFFNNDLNIQLSLGNIQEKPIEREKTQIFGNGKILNKGGEKNEQNR